MSRETFMILGTKCQTKPAVRLFILRDRTRAKVRAAIEVGAGVGVCLLALACRLINCASVINVMISQCKRIFHVIQFVAASSTSSSSSANNNNNHNSNDGNNNSQSICIAFLLYARSTKQKT